MAAHRYWRLRFPSGTVIGGRTYLTIPEVQFRSSIGGSQGATGGTATASSTYSGFPASNAFIGSSFWSSSGSATEGQWIAYDMGVGNSLSVVEFYVKPLSGYSSDMPPYIVCEYSDNDVDWVPELYATGITWANDGTGQAFSNTATRTGGHRFWRVYATGNGAGTNTVLGGTELKFYATIGGPDIAPLTLMTSDTVTDEFTAGKLADGQTPSASGGFFRSGIAGFPHWVLLDFGVDYAPTLAQLDWRAQVLDVGAEHNAAPSGGNIEYSDDGTSFTSVGAIPTGSWSPTGPEIRTLYPTAPLSTGTVPLIFL